MALRAKYCPYCKEMFLRREKRTINGKEMMCCPNPRCYQPLELTPAGNAIKLEDKARIKRVYDHFYQTYMAPISVVYGPPGSRSYMFEMAQAKHILNASIRYLRHTNMHEAVKAEDFAKMVIDFVMTDPSKQWLANKVKSLAQCNGKTFDDCAPEVKKKIDAQRKEQYKETLFDSSRMNIPVMQLG